jgi:hypothetical protein
MEAWQGQAGIALGLVSQFLRAIKGFPEWGYWLVIASVSTALYWLGPDVSPVASKEFWRGAAVWVPILMSMMGGGTLAMSQGSRALVATGRVSAANPLVPVTNSK